MLHKFSDEIHQCNQFADECRRNADEIDDLSRKQHYLDMEARWLHLHATLHSWNKFPTSTRPPGGCARQSSRPPSGLLAQQRGRLRNVAGGTGDSLSVPPAPGRTYMPGNSSPVVHALCGRAFGISRAGSVVTWSVDPNEGSLSGGRRLVPWPRARRHLAHNAWIPSWMKAQPRRQLHG